MIVIEEPPAPPVTLAEAKAFLRAGDDGEDALIGALIGCAGEMCERFTGRALLPRDIMETVKVSSAWTRLGVAPVRAIALIEAMNPQGEGEALPADAYAIDIDAAGDGWVRMVRADGAKLARISYSAGMAAEPDGLPEALRHGIARLAAHLYTERGEAAKAPPAAVTALWRPWRRLRLT
jgi:uncharacterized phiE125 gp8 family phage protein